MIYLLPCIHIFPLLPKVQSHGEDLATIGSSPGDKLTFERAEFDAKEEVEWQKWWLPERGVVWASVELNLWHRQVESSHGLGMRGQPQDKKAPLAPPFLSTDAARSLRIVANDNDAAEKLPIGHWPSPRRIDAVDTGTEQGLGRLTAALANEHDPAAPFRRQTEPKCNVCIVKFGISRSV